VALLGLGEATGLGVGFCGFGTGGRVGCPTILVAALERALLVHGTPGARVHAVATGLTAEVEALLVRRGGRRGVRRLDARVGLRRDGLGRAPTQRVTIVRLVAVPAVGATLRRHGRHGLDLRPVDGGRGALLVDVAGSAGAGSATRVTGRRGLRGLVGAPAADRQHQPEQAGGREVAHSPPFPRRTAGIF